MFSVMVVLWCFAWRALKRDFSIPALRRLFITIAVIFLCYGIAMEFVQRYFVINRSFDMGDIIADAIGCAAGLIFSTRRYIKKIDPCRNRGSQPKLTAYEKIDCFYNKKNYKSITQIYCH